MFGPSGFFQTLGDHDIPSSYADLEIIHDSEAGFNILYRGSKNGRFFVYKALKPVYRGIPLYEELLKKEFNIGFSLTHSGICQYYGMVCLPDIGNCIVMEWVDGCSLEHLLANSKVSKRLALKLIDELCEALSYIHRKQIIHRDLKPENILVTYNGQNVKIIDFGLSDADSYNAFKAPAGTRIYASPELLVGEVIDSRSDIWSLGVIIGELSGKFRHVAARCMARDRDRRYRTAEEVKKAVFTAGRRRFVHTFTTLICCVMAVAGLWILWQEIDIPVPLESSEAVTEMPDTLDVGLPSAPMPEQQSVSLPEQSSPVNENAAESIDAAALEDLFNEASDMLL